MGNPQNFSDSPAAFPGKSHGDFPGIKFRESPPPENPPGNAQNPPGNSPGNGLSRNLISLEMPAGEFPGEFSWGSREISGISRGIPRMAGQISRMPFPGNSPGDLAGHPANAPGNFPGDPGWAAALPGEFPGKWRKIPLEIWTRPAGVGRLGPFWGFVFR